MIKICLPVHGVADFVYECDALGPGRVGNTLLYNVAEGDGVRLTINQEIGLVYLAGKRRKMRMCEFYVKYSLPLL